MNPYLFVKEATANGESLLSLCCGIGLELSGLETPNITAVDVAPQYLAKVKDGYLKNEPHNAWGIEGADHFQTHKSGWTAKELESYGFTKMATANDVSQHGEPYTALMYNWRKDV